MFTKRAKSHITSKVIISLGALTAGAGKFVGGKPGYWLRGFGLAHVILGTLDMFRSKLRSR